MKESEKQIIHPKDVYCKILIPFSEMPKEIERMWREVDTVTPVTSEEGKDEARRPQGRVEDTPQGEG